MKDRAIFKKVIINKSFKCFLIFFKSYLFKNHNSRKAETCVKAYMYSILKLRMIIPGIGRATIWIEFLHRSKYRNNL